MLRSRSFLLASLLALAAVRVALGQPQPTHSGLIYATVGGAPLRLDLYIPSAGAPPYPVVVWIHGGGWSGGTRFPAGNAAALLNAGFAVASVDTA